MRRVAGRTGIWLVVAGGCLLSTPGAHAFTGWSAQTSGVTSNLTSVWCTDDSHCWATDSTGKVIVTVTGGSAWSVQTTSVSQQLNGLACSDSSHCWAVGNAPSGGAATVIVTSNGGSTWTAQTSGDVGHNWLALSCPSGTVCFAAQSAGKVYATGNGGTSWTGQSTGASTAQQAIACPSTTACFTADANGKVYSTTNAGSSWTARTTGATNLDGIACTDTSHCWAAGSTGTVYATSNAGTSWSAQSTGLSALTSIDCVSGTNVSCWAVGTGGSIAATSNGGTSWSTATAGAAQLNAVEAVDPSHLWTVGNGGVIYTYVTCSLGSLGLGSPSMVSLPSVTLPGTDTSVTTSTGLTPDDETGNLAGWNISATSTTFTNAGGKTLPTNATEITAGSASASAGSCSLPTNSITYPVSLPAASSPPTAVKVFDAAAGSGAGPNSVTLTEKLLVPAKAYSGTYSSTWIYTIASGP